MDDFFKLADEAISAADRTRAEAAADFTGEYSEAHKDFFDAASERLGLPTADELANERELDKAILNISAAKTENTDKEATVIRAAKRLGLPKDLVRLMDNSELSDTINTHGLAQGLKRWLGKELSNAIVSKGSLEHLDGIFRMSEGIVRQERSRIQWQDTMETGTLSDRIVMVKNAYEAGRIRYTDAQIDQLREYRGLTPDPKSGDGWFIGRSGERVRFPVLDQWVMREDELEAWSKTELRKQFDAAAAETRASFADFRADLDNWETAFSGGGGSRYALLLVKEIAAMTYLREEYGDDWQDMTDKDLSDALWKISVEKGVNLGDVVPERLRESDWTEHSKEYLKKAIDWYGAHSAGVAIERWGIGEKMQALGTEAWASLSPTDKGQVITALEETARSLRGRTWAAAATEEAIQAVRYVGEFVLPAVLAAPTFGGSLAAGGTGVATGAAARGAMNFAMTAFRRAAIDAARRTALQTAFSAPRVFADARSRLERSPLSATVVEGGISFGTSPAQTDSVPAAILNAVLNQGIENFSEIAGGRMLGLAARGMLPDKVLESAFVRSWNKVMGAWDTTKAGRLTRIISEKGAWHGVMEEYGEEKVAEFLRVLSTDIAGLTGTEYGDLNADSVFGTLEEEGELFGTLLWSNAVLRSVGTAYGVAEMYRTGRNYNAQVAAHEQIMKAPLTAKSPEAMQDLLMSTRFGGISAMTAESAETLFQSAPEILEAVGINSEDIRLAKLKGSFIPFSMAQAHVKLDGPQFQQLAAVSLIDTDQGTSMKDVKALDLSEEAYEKEQKRREQDGDGIRKAMDAKFRQLIDLGRPADETRAVMEILGKMAFYHSRYGGRSGAEWLNNLDLNKMTEAAWRNLTGYGSKEDSSKVDRAIEKAVADMFPVPVERTAAEEATENERETLALVAAAVYPELTDGSGVVDVDAYLRLVAQKKQEIQRVIDAYNEKRKQLPENTAQDTAENEPVRDINDRLVEWYRKLLDWKDDARIGLVANYVSKHGLPTLLEDDMQMAAYDRIAKVLSEQPDATDAYLQTVVQNVFAKVANKFTKESGRLVSAETPVGEDGSSTVGDTIAGRRSDSPEEQAVDAEVAARKKEWFASLSEDDKTIIRMAKKAKQQEIAATLGVSDATISKRIKALKASLTSYLVGGEAQHQDPRFQSADSGHRGVTWTDATDLKTIITLFENADASTLIHELAHYCFNSMEESIRLGIADQRMIDDFNTLKKWAEGDQDNIISTALRQMRAEAENDEGKKAEYRHFLARIQKDKDAVYRELKDYLTRANNGETVLVDPATRRLLQLAAVEQGEKLARGFEAYIREGKVPTAELTGAMSTMRRLLHWVYKAAEMLGVRLTDEVRTVFDGILATEQTVERDSLVEETVRLLRDTLEGMDGELRSAFSTIAERAKDQAVEELQKRKAAELEDLRRKWRAEATAEMENDPRYKAWRAIMRDGVMDFATVEALIGTEGAEILLGRGLTTRSGRKTKDGRYPNAVPGVQPADYAAKFGFATVKDMLVELLRIKSPQMYEAEYIFSRTVEYHNEMTLDENEMSTEATLEYFETITDKLHEKIGGREGAKRSKAALKARASAEVAGMTVHDIIRGNDSSKPGSRVPQECRENLKKFVEAVAAKDYISAFDAANNLRYRLEVLNQVGKYRQAVQKAERLVKRAISAKKGVIDGAYKAAIQDLALRFGFSAAKPITAYSEDGGQETFETLLARHNERLRAEGLYPIEASDFLLHGSMAYRNLKFDAFMEVAAAVDFLNGAGREIVSTGKETFREKVNARLNGVLGALSEQPHKYTKPRTPLGKLAGMFRFAGAIGSKLRNMMGFADSKDSRVFKDWYSELNTASSRQLQLLLPLQARVKSAVEKLNKIKGTIRLDGLPEFPQDVKTEGYEWSADKVFVCCLNMGNETNRQRLRDGFEWTDAQLDDIASRLSPEAWAEIQNLWDTINDRHITNPLRRVFRDENFFDLKMEEATPFTVRFPDGTEQEIRGGYYPLSYLFRRNPEAAIREEIKGSIPGAHRKPSFTFERVKNVTDPVSLDPGKLLTHLFDTTHYITHRKIMRETMRVVNNHDFESEFTATQGPERFAEMKGLLETMADPHAALAAVSEMANCWARWARGSVTATALWLNPSSIAMQFTSLTLGWDELGGYIGDAYNPANFKANFDRAVGLSGMMRDRLNMKDVDLRSKLADLTDTQVQSLFRKLTSAGYRPMVWADMMIAVPAWNAAYEKARGEGKGQTDAIAAADEFVAKTQGAARMIDLSPAQISARHPVAYFLSMFFTAASAAMTHTSAKVRAIGKGDLTVGQALFAGLTTIATPIALQAMVRALFAGPWDDDDDTDRAWRAMTKEVLVYPFQGMPVVRDLVEAAAEAGVNRAFGQPARSFGREPLSAPALRAANEIVKNAISAFDSATKGNFKRGAYLAADAASRILRVPVVYEYQRILKQLDKWGVDEDFLKSIDLNELTKDKKKRRKTR